MRSKNEISVRRLAQVNIRWYMYPHLASPNLQRAFVVTGPDPGWPVRLKHPCGPAAIIHRGARHGPDWRGTLRIFFVSRIRIFVVMMGVFWRLTSQHSSSGWPAPYAGFSGDWELS
jgi:hypothetical protein